MNQKIITLAKKLKALADHGIDGEKINAELQLQKLLSKHGLYIQDIETDKIDYHVFDVPVKYKLLFNQVVVSICNNQLENVYGYKNSKTKRIVECTASEAIEIQAKYDFYCAAYKKDLIENENIFFKAFIQKNALYSNQPAEEKDLTPAEMYQLFKVFSVADSLSKHNYYKQLK